MVGQSYPPVLRQALNVGCNGMKPHILQILFILLCTHTFGQRLIGKTIYTFTKPFTIDTVSKARILRFTVTADTIRNISDKAHSFKTLTFDQINYCDSLIKSNFYNAIVLRDSMQFIRNHVRTLGATYKPADFSTYKLQKVDFYKRIQKSELKRLKKSDRYYSEFLRNNQKFYVVLFDPPKLKKRIMGDIIWFDYLDAFIIEPLTESLYFDGTLDWK
jgi:hypothetical protein